MGIIKVDPFRGIDGMMRRVSDVFEDINRGGIRFEVGDFTPRVDISEEDRPMFDKFINMLNECDDVQEVYHNAGL